MMTFKHRIFQPLERQRKHTVADQLLDDADALAVLPYVLITCKNNSSKNASNHWKSIC